MAFVQGFTAKQMKQKMLKLYALSLLFIKKKVVDSFCLPSPNTDKEEFFDEIPVSLNR